MTCVVAIEERGTVYMGADSLWGIPESWTCQTGSQPKLFTVEQEGSHVPLLFGATGKARMGQLLKWNLLPPPHPDPEAATTTEEYVVSQLVPTIRKCFEKGGWLETKEGRQLGGHFLLGYRGALYEVQDDFQVSRWEDGYAAIGSAYDVALGSLYTSQGREPRLRLTTALEAAEKHNMGVRRPFRFAQVSVVEPPRVPD